MLKYFTALLAILLFNKDWASSKEEPKCFGAGVVDQMFTSSYQNWSLDLFTNDKDDVKQFDGSLLGCTIECLKVPECLSITHNDQKVISATLTAAAVCWLNNQICSVTEKNCKIQKPTVENEPTQYYYERKLDCKL